jgi:electron transport complex protein RnfB
VIEAAAVFGSLGLALGLGLGWAGTRLGAERGSLAEAIDRLLPQTQCAQCGYPGCRPYAEAIALGEAPLNRCPPGGQATVDALARLLGESGSRLACDLPPAAEGLVARVRESECIGCALCLDACPVDAIVGAPRRMHTVIAAECTGCALCLAPCPVDCIELAAARE